MVSENTARLRLIQRSLDNRALMVEYVARAVNLRSEAQGARAQSQLLRKQLRANLAALRAGRLATREWCAAQRTTRPAPKYPIGRFSRLSGAPPDLVDASRSALHDMYASTGDPAIRAELVSSYDGFARSLALKFRHRESVDELTAEQADSPSVEAVAARCELSVERVLEAMELRVTQAALPIDAPMIGGPDDAVLDPGAEDAGFGRLENQELLGRLLDRLSTRDRRIVELRFNDELTQAEIAEEIGVSQMCVSRVLARTLGRLRIWARTAVA